MFASITCTFVCVKDLSSNQEQKIHQMQQTNRAQKNWTERFFDKSLFHVCRDNNSHQGGVRLILYSAFGMAFKNIFRPF